MTTTEAPGPASRPEHPQPPARLTIRRLRVIASAVVLSTVPATGTCETLGPAAWQVRRAGVRTCSRTSTSTARPSSRRRCTRVAATSPSATGRHALGAPTASQASWLPPDPPPGHGVHRYAFQLFALAAGNGDCCASLNREQQEKPRCQNSSVKWKSMHLLKRSGR